MSERKASYDIGQYTQGFGPGKAGLWFVRRTVVETIAYSETNGEAEAIARAFRNAEHAQSK